MYWTGSANVPTTTHLEKEIAMVRWQCFAEWQCHRMIVDGQYLDAVDLQKLSAHHDVRVLNGHERALEFVQRGHHHRPKPVCGQSEMELEFASEFGFEIVRGLCDPLLEQHPGELGSAIPCDVGDERLIPSGRTCATPRIRQGTHGAKAMCKAGLVLEAILLVGGQGTRLRPLTNETPKPMLPVAGRPCTEHQIARLREAGVTRVILGTSYRAEVFAEYFGDGSAFGVELVCVTETEPLGTGGAIRNVLSELRSGPNDPVLILNGDVLSGHDMAAQVAQHHERAADVTLHLINVDDPRPFGLVPTDADGKVLAFLEKPQRPEDIVTHQINAGCYVFARRVIDKIPSGRVVSVERETFPELLKSGAPVFGWIEDAYWLDLGNPLAFAQGSRDLVTGKAPSTAVPGPIGQSLLLDDVVVDQTATIDGGSCIGVGAQIGAHAVVTGSVIMDGAVIGDCARIENSIIGRRATIGAHTSAVDTVIADRAIIGAHNEFAAGTRVFPDTVIGNTAIRLSSDHS